MSGIWIIVGFGILGGGVISLCAWLAVRFEGSKYDGAGSIAVLFLGMIAAVALVSVGVGLADRHASDEFASVECVECGETIGNGGDRFCAGCGAAVDVKEK